MTSTPQSRYDALLDSQDLYCLLLDIQNGVTAPGHAAMANGALLKIDAARKARRIASETAHGQITRPAGESADASASGMESRAAGQERPLNTNGGRETGHIGQPSECLTARGEAPRVPAAASSSFDKTGEAYVPLTAEQIEELREYTRLNMAPRQVHIETLCDMAINALLYAEEIHRLRDGPIASAERHGGWRSMWELPQVTERTEMLFRKEWTGRDGKVRATHEVLYLWPDGVLTDFSETVVALEEMPTQWMPIQAHVVSATVSVPRNMALVCATCRLPVPDDGKRFCDAGEACPHRADSRVDR